MLGTKLVLVVTFALVQPAGAVVGVGHHDHPVSGRCRDLLAPGGNTPWGRAPAPVVAAHWLPADRLVVRGAVDGETHPVADLLPHGVVLHLAVLDVRHNAGGQAGGEGVAPLSLSGAGGPAAAQLSQSFSSLLCFVFCVV